MPQIATLFQSRDEISGLNVIDFGGLLQQWKDIMALHRNSQELFWCCFCQMSTHEGAELYITRALVGALQTWGR
jgi:hypothetical protein